MLIRNIEKRKREILDLTLKLISIDTSEGKEGEAALFLSEYFEEYGFETRLEGEEGRENLILGSFNASMIFNGHLDVVPPGRPEGWRNPPFKPYVKDGAVYGRGACDMKGAVASMAVAYITLAEAFKMDDILLMFTADEESGGFAGLGMFANKIDATMGVIGEPTDMNIVSSHKGSIGVRIRVKGIPAHGSKPELGINAIYYASKMIQDLTEMEFVKEDPVLGKPTLMVSLIWGGEKLNMVPDTCEFLIDRRMIPGESGDMALKEIRDVVEKYTEYGIDVDVEKMFEMSPVKVDEGERVIELARNALEKVGIKPSIEGMSGCSDARFLVERGIPTILLGPGKTELAHGYDEHIDIESLEQAAMVYGLMMYECMVMG